jgi:hypothetical protein
MAPELSPDIDLAMVRLLQKRQTARHSEIQTIPLPQNQWRQRNRRCQCIQIRHSFETCICQSVIIKWRDWERHGKDIIITSIQSVLANPWFVQQIRGK